MLCAATTFRSTGISSFLKIFVGIFSTEAIVFGFAVLAGRAGLWPANYAEYLPPESLPLTVAIFSIIVYVVAQSGTVGQIMRIANRFFNADEFHRAHDHFVSRWLARHNHGLGTLITHLIGRPLIGLYFQWQHMEADFRFSLARLREYSEQVALLDGENAEQTMVGQRLGALITNYLALVYRRMRVTAFTHTFGQISPIIPYVFTAPFYFARKIELGVMTQTAGAFGHVAGALTFFVNYYTYLAGFKSVVDRLNSFDAAIDQAEALSEAGPKRASVGSTPAIDLENIDLSLPDGRCAVETRHLVLAEGERVVLSGPSGSGKSTLFRAIAGIWPFGTGDIRYPAGIRTMLVPAKPYIPISTLRASKTRRLLQFF